MAKTYQNTSSGLISIAGKEIAAGETNTFDFYLHHPDLTLTADTDPTDIVAATGTVSKDTAGTETVTPTLDNIHKVEVQAVVTSGSFELYFNDATNTPATIPLNGSFNMVVDTKFLNSIIFKALEDSSVLNYNIVLRA